MIVSSRRLVPATVLALLVSLLLAVPARAADTGSVSGTVTARPSGGTAVPYAGASILFDRLHETGGNDNALVRAESDSSGHFSVAGVPDGRYQIRTYPKVYGELGQYGYEYYDDQWGPYGATEVVVDGGAVTLANPIELRPIGKVVGTVRNEAGQPMPGVYVGFRQGNGGGYSTVTDAQGRYDSLEGEWSDNLIPGDYVVEATTSGYDAGDPKYYYDTHPVTVRPGVATTQDITLRQRPTATFTVLDSAGAPVADAPILIELRDPRYHDGEWGPIQSGPHTTDELGRYQFTNNAAEVRFQVRLPEGYAGTDVPEWWQDAYSPEEARVLSFPDGVALDRRFTVQLGPPVVDPPVVDPPVVNPPVVNPPVVDPPVVVPPAVVPPAVGVLRTTRPRVVGLVRLGKKLVASVRAWSPAPVKLSFQWLRDGKPIKKRTARTYRLGQADVGHRISVRVVGRKVSYATATVKSPATAKVRR